ncbi:unnamed protein product [Phytophthora fragariaefolia]|uniref:Unnamed protein product n=1 Tax=Phytophthora fragariaefolia TaxID=1490495 RepID=A0A9W6XFI0_9STRA|nr:unnamed protein product [Phytophthora fragariaefolia]
MEPPRPPKKRKTQVHFDDCVRAVCSWHGSWETAWEAPEGRHYTAVNGLGDLRIRPTSLRSPSVGVVGVEWEANEFLPVCYTTTGAATREQGVVALLDPSQSTSKQEKIVKTPANTKGTTPVATGGRSSARPRLADAATKATASTPRSVKFDRVGDQDHGSDDGSEDGLEMKGPRPILDDEEVDELTMVVGKAGAPRPIARRLGSEFDEVTPARAFAPDERPSRPPVNGDTTNAYKILGQVGRSMVATSVWMMMFGPKEVGGVKWATLEKDLASPIDNPGLTQLAKQTKRLLAAMGFECAVMPSEVALQIWELGDASAELTRWKRKLKDSFGCRSSMTVRKLDGIDSSTVPLPSTPKKAPAGAGFLTPATKGDDTDDEDDDDDYAGRDYAGPCEDLAAQVRRSYHHEDDDGAQRTKLTHHISLSKLSKFNGTRNRSERSLGWLKKFIFEMEGTNTPQDRWCEPFQGCQQRRLGRNGLGCARRSWPITAHNTTSPPKIGTTQRSGTTTNTSAATCCD